METNEQFEVLDKLKLGLNIDRLVPFEGLERAYLAASYHLDKDS